MKKHLANIITSVRIVLSPLLFLSVDLNSTFITVYLICAASDLFDGPVARKTNSTGIVGSVLDTTGDFLMYAGMMKVMIVSKRMPLWSVVWLASTLVVHCISAMIAVFRFGKLYFTHSASSKVLGGMMFLVPFAFIIGIGPVYMALTSTVSTFSSIEAVVIQLRTDEPDANIWSWRNLVRKAETSAVILDGKKVK